MLAMVFFMMHLSTRSSSLNLRQERREMIGRRGDTKRHEHGKEGISVDVLVLAGNRNGELEKVESQSRDQNAVKGWRIERTRKCVRKLETRFVRFALLGCLDLVRR